MIDFDSVRRHGLLAVAMIAAMSCATAPPPPRSPVELAGERATTIAIAPLDVAADVPKELRSSVGIVSSAMIEHLALHEKVPVRLDRGLVAETWIESARQISQSEIENTFENAASLLARKLSETIQFDALVLPVVYLQNAIVREDGTARWDAATQAIEFVGQSKWEIELPPLATIPAASILLHVFDRDGGEIHVKRTGLELIQHMSIRTEQSKGHDKRTWVLTDDVPAMSDPTRIGAAIEHAFFPFLPKGKR